MFRIHIFNGYELELISYARAEELFHCIDAHRDYLSNWLVWPGYIRTAEDYRAFVKRSLLEYANQESLVFCITCNGKAIGTAGFIHLEPELEKGEIGYWLSPEYQGNGIATAVVGKLVELGFEQLQLSKVEASVAVENLKSQRVCERAGMVVEGVIAQAERINGVLLAHKKYAICRK